jgi:hypothetical protein
MDGPIVGKTCSNCGYEAKKETAKFCTQCKRPFSYRTKEQKREEFIEQAKKMPRQKFEMTSSKLPPLDNPEMDPSKEPKIDLDPENLYPESPNPFSDPPAGGAVTSPSSVSPAGSPYSGVPASKVSRKTGELIGSTLGRILSVATGEKLLSEESTALESSFGDLAERHPEWFGKGLIADIITAVAILAVIIAVVKRRGDRVKREKTQAQGQRTVTP